MESFDQKIKNRLSSIEFNKKPDSIKMDEMFEKLEVSKNHTTQVVKMIPKWNLNRPSNQIFKIAASLAIFMVAAFSLYQINNESISVIKGDKISYLLPDGSKVEINADSRLSYNKLLWYYNRQVLLEGEAFFEVEKGKTFTVLSEKGKTQVLGTSFNIFSRGPDYKVECFTGRVKVNFIGGKDEVILTPGQRVHFGKQLTREIRDFNINEHRDWRVGEYYFDNEPLKNVIASLVRQYNVEVKMSRESEELKYTGYFNDKELKTALKIICDPLELQYEIKDNIVVIR